MPREPLVDPQTVAGMKPVADVEDIRRYNRQRYEMEQLSGVIQLDLEKQLIVTYKDVTDREFWVRGHIPDRPLMPGVMMLEAAAQTCSYYYGRSTPDPRFLGFMGLEQVRFRGTVVPGDRLIIAAHCLELKSRRLVFQCRVLGTPV
jgi:3-hydroxyacyl-[acyl-carrier-protein] dehydratase